jgi:Amt family ammonium transporter
MKKHLLKIILSITAFFSFSGIAIAETTMSEEGQYIFNSLAFYMQQFLII